MMPNGIRTIQIILGGLCAMFGLIVVLEVVLPVADVTASPSAPRAVATQPVLVQATPDDLDGLVGQVLERPLFTASRQPPAAKDTPDVAADAPPPAPPELPGRLAGVIVGPDELQALFAPPGAKPVAVGMGEAIGGWTVKTIELDRVVLTSAFGDHVIEPTPGARSDLARPIAPKPPLAQVRRVSAPTVQPGRAGPGAPGAQQQVVPAAPTGNRPVVSHR
jgi:hypothetical protein